jgi:hypothetical protein
MIIYIDNVLERMYEILDKDSIVSCKIKFTSFRDANKFYNTITDEALLLLDPVIVGDIVITIITQDDKDIFDDLITHFDFSEISII